MIDKGFDDCWNFVLFEENGGDCDEWFNFVDI